MGQNHPPSGSGERNKGKAVYKYYSTWTCCACTVNGGSGGASGMSVTLNPSCHNCCHIIGPCCPREERKQQIGINPRIKDNSSQPAQFEAVGIGRRLRSTKRSSTESKPHIEDAFHTDPRQATTAVREPSNASKMPIRESKLKTTEKLNSQPIQETMAGGQTENKAIDTYHSTLGRINLVAEETEKGLDDSNLKENWSSLAPAYSEEGSEVKLLEQPYVGEILSTHGKQETSQPNCESQRTLVGRTVRRQLERVYIYMDRLFRPRVALGYRRLEWQMECGTWLYDDYENSDPGRLEQFYQELTSSEAADAAPQNTNGVASNPGYSPISPSTTSSIATAQSSPSMSFSSNTSLSSGPSASIPLASSSTPITVEPLIRKFFAICVNAGLNLTTLGEIDVSSIDHDGDLFSKMWAEYDCLRGFRNGFFRRLLIQPVDVNYVHFTVEEHQRADISCDKPIVPPPDEVAAKNYEYNPCPLDYRPSPKTFLHYRSCPACTTCGKKTKKYLNRLPKKLSRGLLDVYLRAQPDEYIVGWGVLIIEGPNKRAITLLSASMLTLSVVIAVLYTVFAKDASSGFTIGSFVVAVWVSWMTAFYYHAKET